MNWKDDLLKLRAELKPKEHRRMTHKEIIARKILDEKRVSPMVKRRRWIEIAQ